MRSLARHAEKILAIEAGSAPSAEAIASAVAKACEKVTERFAPIVGEAGIRTLYERALVLAVADTPSLAPARTDGARDEWAKLRKCIEGHDADTAADAAVVLLSAFVGILGRFIGDTLVARILHDVWPAAFPRRPSKETT